MCVSLYMCVGITITYGECPGLKFSIASMLIMLLLSSFLYFAMTERVIHHPSITLFLLFVVCCLLFVVGVVVYWFCFAKEYVDKRFPFVVYPWFCFCSCWCLFCVLFLQQPIENTLGSLWQSNKLRTCCAVLRRYVYFLFPPFLSLFSAFEIIVVVPKLENFILFCYPAA